MRTAKTEKIKAVCQVCNAPMNEDDYSFIEWMSAYTCDNAECQAEMEATNDFDLVGVE